MKSRRLTEIANLVKKDSIVADIGTDHGYIPVYLIENNIAKKVIGSDISKGSLSKIIDYVDSRGLGHKIETRLGNGLEVIKPFEIDTVIIAGMGGILIKDILDKNWALSKSINHLILQPMIGVKELREYLLDNGYKIVDNKLLKEEGKYYEIIYAKVGIGPKWKEFDLEVPRQFIDERHPLLKEYINFKLHSAESILDNIKNTDSQKVRGRILELEASIRNYKGVLSEIES